MKKTATVFGGTGFLGHAVVQTLAARGYNVRVPTRNLEKAKDLRLMGFPGQIVPFPASTRSDAAVAASLAGSQVVVNLIGILAEHGKASFQATHVETAARIARLAKTEGAAHFVHVSALGADKKARAHYAQTKALGEEAVFAFFPDAVILRPSVMFGPRDMFLNRFARMARFLPFLPLIGDGATRLQPVFVGDVAEAVSAVFARCDGAGRTFLLGGPEILTFKELLTRLLVAENRRRALLPVPWAVAAFFAALAERLPGAPLTRDQIRLLQTDNVVPSYCPPEATFAGLGLSPRRLFFSCEGA